MDERLEYVLKTRFIKLQKPCCLFNVPVPFSIIEKVNFAPACVLAPVRCDVACNE